MRERALVACPGNSDAGAALRFLLRAPALELLGRERDSRAAGAERADDVGGRAAGVAPDVRGAVGAGTEAQGRVDVVVRRALSDVAAPGRANSPPEALECALDVFDRQRAEAHLPASRAASVTKKS